MQCTFKILRTNKVFVLGLDGSLQLQDIADYLLDNQEIESLNIGIYSQNKKYYTENKDEQLLSIGTGEDDTYLILEGHEQNNLNTLTDITDIQIQYTFNIPANKRKVTVELEWNTQLKDLAECFYEYNQTSSLNIGIYSENKKYYTDNQEEQLINIGTGSDDTYLILEGDLKDQCISEYYNSDDPKVIQRGIVIYLYINIDGNITKEKIIVNPAMKICELISLIQTNYHIEDVQLLKKKNWVDIELHLPKYQMQTLEEVGVKKYQTFQVSKNPISPLKIHIVDGALVKILNLTLNMSTATLYDIKLSVETYISVISNLPNEFFVADLYLENLCYRGQEKLSKPFKQLNVSKKTKIEAKIRYIG